MQLVTFSACVSLQQVCDVSTLLGECSLGRHYYPALRVKVSDEVHFTLRASAAVDARLLSDVRPHKTKTWQVQNVRDPCTGLLKGVLAFFWELADAVVALVVLPVQATCHNGLRGLVLGICAACFLLFAR